MPSAQEAKPVEVVVKVEVVEAKPKRTLTQAQKDAMAEGRRKAAERRKAEKAASEESSEASDRSSSPSSVASKKPGKKAVEKKALGEKVAALESRIAEMVKELAEAKECLAELEEDEEEELPRFKADGTLDKRYKDAKRIERADGGLDLRFKISKNAIKKGLVNPDGSLQIAKED